MRVKICVADPAIFHEEYVIKKRPVVLGIYMYNVHCAYKRYYVKDKKEFNIFHTMLNFGQPFKVIKGLCLILVGCTEKWNDGK